MKEGRKIRGQSHPPARARERGRSAESNTQVTDKVGAAAEQAAELDRLLDRLDAGIADEKRKMSVLLTRLRTRVAA